MGPIHYLGILIVIGALVVLRRLRRNAPLDPLELGALILVILVAGPLSWDHYFVWARFRSSRWPMLGIGAPGARVGTRRSCSP